MGQDGSGRFGSKSIGNLSRKGKSERTIKNGTCRKRKWTSKKYYLEFRGSISVVSGEEWLNRVVTSDTYGSRVVKGEHQMSGKEDHSGLTTLKSLSQIRGSYRKDFRKGPDP